MIRPEVGIFLMSIVATESSGGDWKAHDSGSSFYGAFQINIEPIQRFGRRLYGKNISPTEFLNNPEMQVRIAQALYDEKKIIVEQIKTGEQKVPNNWLKPNDQNLPQYFSNKPELYNVAYAWLSLAGKDGNNVFSTDYAEAASRNSRLVMENSEGGNKALDELLNNPLFNSEEIIEKFGSDIEEIIRKNFPPPGRRL